jgi:hypothetical protein
MKCVVVLTNDRSYWQPGSRPDTIDAAFRLHEGRVLTGSLAWAARRTRNNRQTGRPNLTSHYTCQWRDFSDQPPREPGDALPVSAAHRQPVTPVGGYPAQQRRRASQPLPDPPRSSAVPVPGTVHDEIWRLRGSSPDGTFTLMQVVARCGARSRYRNRPSARVTSRMCADALFTTPGPTTISNVSGTAATASGLRPTERTHDQADPRIRADRGDPCVSSPGSPA